MYQLLLCWRYLRTRYIALASIVSVTLGVATMIVVNSVMAGFSTEMMKRIHGILSDVVFECHSLEGFPDPDWHMAEIRRVAGKHIDGMTCIVAVPAMLSFQLGGNWVTRPVQVVGIDESTKEQAGEFAQYLLHPQNREHFSFTLRENGFDIHDHQAGPKAPAREGLRNAGWIHRRQQAAWQAIMVPPAKGTGYSQPISDPQPIGPSALQDQTGPRDPNGPRDQAGRPSQAAIANAPQGILPATPLDELRPEFVPPSDPSLVNNPFAGRPDERRQFDPAKEQHTGIVVGFALATHRGSDKRDHFLVRPGDDVKLTMPTAGVPPRAVDASFTVVDLYESKMSEYDATFVFVPIQRLQELRGMFEPNSGARFVTAIQIKLKDPAEGPLVRDLLRDAKTADGRSYFPPGIYGISTWKDKQGPLLAAVAVETSILNVLLFMIIAVAGFGILATFYMIVVEKTKDIGIMKSLGASQTGVMTIFLGYGLSLGLVGSGVGMILGLLFTDNINAIADGLGWISGQEVFDPTIYYFYRIPAIIDPFTIAWITAGAVGIAVSASVLPALRAARLHPVEALRYE